MAVGGGGANGGPLPFDKQSRCSSGGSSVPRVSQPLVTGSRRLGYPVVCRNGFVLYRSCEYKMPPAGNGAGGFFRLDRAVVNTRHWLQRKSPEQVQASRFPAIVFSG